MNYSSSLIEKIDGSIAKKVDLITKSPARYIVRAFMASLFLTLGTAIAVTVGMKADHIAEGSGKFVYAFMFSWSLVMIIYMNAELGTSNMMYMTVGVYEKKLKLPMALKILGTCVVANLVAGVVCGYLMSKTAAFTNLEADAFLFTAVVGKLEKTTIQILVEGIFANIVVNVAVIATMRMKDDAGKIIATVFIIFIFAFLGFEHVIANFVSFPMAYFSSNGAIEAMTLGNVMHNWIFAFIGNYIGGGLIMGLNYGWLNQVNSKYLD